MGFFDIIKQFALTVAGAGLGFIAGGPPGAAIGAGIASGYGALHEGASLGEAAISAGTAAVGGYYGGQAFSDWASPTYVDPFSTVTTTGAPTVAATSFGLGDLAKYTVGTLALTSVASSLTQAPEPPTASPYTYQPPEPAPTPTTPLPPTPPTGELTPIAPEMEAHTSELPARLREPTPEDIDIMNARERERQAAFSEQRTSEELKKIQLLGARDVNLSPATRESEPTTALERLYGTQKSPGRAIHAYA